MYEASSSRNGVTPQKVRRPRALEEMQLNSILAGDQGTSSEDEISDGRAIPSDDAQTALGISIGQEQTRLTSPRTPAVEKQAAIEAEGGFFGGVSGFSRDRVSEEPEDEAEAERVQESDSRAAVAGAARDKTSSSRHPIVTIPERSLPTPEERLPSPWRAEAKRSWMTKSVLRDGLARPQASSGHDSTLESWQKAIMSSLPSMPKYLNFTSPFSSSYQDTRDDDAESNKSAKRPSVPWRASNGNVNRQTTRQPTRQRSESDSRRLDVTRTMSPQERAEADGTLGDLPSRTELQAIRSRPSQLRRSTSDNSLITQRTLSRVSSLGDDSRFENVQDQVNSRLKAIRDSWQDSNIKLPSLPSISSLRPDFLRERANVNMRKNGGSYREEPEDPMTGHPYHSVKAAVNDNKAQTQHPHFNRALEQLEGDIVVLGGYRGSILRSAEPPHRQLWVPIKVGLNIRKVDLEVGIDADADERAAEKIIPGGMLSHIGPIDISRRLLKKLRHSENARRGKLRVHEYGYDWRLDPHYLSKQLQTFLAGLQCNRPGTAKETRGATVIAHSLGGLITRHAINQGPELFNSIVYAGVPNTCVNILGPMRNGDEVLLSSRVLTAQVNFTIRTSFALLPLDGRCFFDKQTKEEFPVDFFDPQTWIEYRLSPCIARPLPPLTAQPKPSGITGYVSYMTSALPSLPSLPSLPLPGRKKGSADASKTTTISGITEPDTMSPTTANGDNVMAEGNFDTSERGRDPSTDTSASARTTVTIPREEAIAYLTRTLANVKRFKQELAFIPTHATNNKYPPISAIYGKTTPTVYGAKVNGREGIKHADAYDELAFASGDGVVLARAAMVPEGYTTARGGIVSSDRGHVTLLGDLEAVGKCLNAVIAARRKGVGCGTS